MGNHVFVCYAREDEAFVLKLAASLRNLGVPIWLDQWDIPSGADWDLTIDNALYDCAQFLIVLSETSVESLEVRSELRTVLDEKKPIVPILIQSCRIPRQLRLIQRADFTSCNPDDVPALNQVLKALGMGAATPKELAETENLVRKEKTKSPINQTIGAEDAKNWYSKGRDLYLEGNLVGSVKCYDKAIELDPKDAYPWNGKGIVLFDQKKYDEAIKCYDKAIKLDPKFAQPWNAKGLCSVVRRSTMKPSNVMKRPLN